MNRKWLLATALVALAQGVPAYGVTDPTRPPWLGAVAGARAPAGLQAIVLDGPRRLALIDGRLAAVGARIGAERLIAIRHNSVVLRGRRGTRRLFLIRGADVKKAAVLGEGGS